MNKICTSLEQSKKLMELGINVNTADMLWTYDFTINDINSLNVISKHLKPEENDIPAWSLSALLGMMPRIEHLKPFIDLSPKLNSEEVAIYYHSEDSPYIVRDNLIDAAYEMVVWLKENEKI